ncbi:MAG: Crp/Fnr family transcriptional regulator [Crocinitomicaceae bacterium]|nr:Crp/Fnr family transcriptional regulator [Crocinitomicaceae bacterium]
MGKRIDDLMLEKSHKHVTCETCGALKDSLFCSLTGDELTSVDSNKSCSYFKKDQPLFIEGSLPRGVFCINEGKVKIYSRGEDGKEQIIHVATTGEIVGFRAMFSGEAYGVAANTLEESNICFIGKGDFLNMVDTNVNLRNGILRELSKELADRASFIKNMAQKSVRERLASSLLILDDIYAEDFINLSREDLANFVGTATETLIRLLKDFKDEGLVKTHVRKIEVLDKEGLIQLAGS